MENICKEKDIIFIIDEVQTGVGRTGTFLASEQFDVKPNITTLAKGLGGGLPIGAILMDDVVKDVFTYGDHGSTFGGNPVVCAGALAVLGELFDNKYLERVSEKADYIREKLLEIPQVKDVSGLGMMIGIKLDDSFTAGEVAGKCVENGLLILTAKDKLRMLPPLNITQEEIDKGIRVLKKSLFELEYKVKLSF